MNYGDRCRLNYQNRMPVFQPENKLSVIPVAGRPVGGQERKLKSLEISPRNDNGNLIFMSYHRTNVVLFLEQDPSSG